MNATATLELRRLDRAGVQPHLAQLAQWLLPDSLYGVQHTWPQLYRSDGDGRFVGLFRGERLLSHCAWRYARTRTAHGELEVALLGSVATDPEERGLGHASRLLDLAVAECRAAGCAAVLLWAEHETLYRRAGFVTGASETCCVLTDVGAVRADGVRVRLATIADHDRLHALHERKPLGVIRSRRTMSGLLTTPGMWTCVLERDGALDAYACSGKGADLQNWWHELGGSDADVACLLPLAMQLVEQSESIVLLPPYREALAAHLAPFVAETATIAGPMVCTLTDAELPPFWVDGLDSV